MPRKTVLEIVNMYLIKSNGFRVQSIYDSDEAESAAHIAEEVFYHIVEKVPNIQFTESVIRLDHANDTNAPNYLKLPVTVSRIVDSEIKYNHTKDNVTTNYRKIQYMDPRDFLDYVSNFKNTSQNVVEVIDPTSGIRYFVRNDKHPEYFTSFDGSYLAFDSFDIKEDTTLQSDKSLALVSKEPVFLLQDNFYPPLPNHLFSVYQDGVVAECMEIIRSEPAPEIRRRYRTEMAKLQKTNQRVGYYRTGRVSYGRKR